MSQSVHDIPGKHQDQVFVEAITTSEADSVKACWVAPFDAKMTGFKYVSTIAVTGANTNSVTLEVTGVNAATTLRASLALVTGTDLVALVDSTIPLEAAGEFDVSEGDVLSFRNNEIGTGLGASVGPGTWVIEYEGR